MELGNLKFDNKFATLGESFFTRLKPTGFANPFLLSFNNAAAELIGLDKTSTDIADYFCGNKLIPGADYLASVYSGHQFGTYVPQLGDGRAILIGEVNGWELQLKGAGKTPYSRFGDGRAVLRSSIREYLCSEAMHNLGIPTTRALCIIGSDEDVQRETVEKAAMITRMAPTHIRFGHFEYFYYTGQHEKLRELADFTIRNFYSGMNYEEFFAEVVKRTARLIAKWQTVGFAHGVMNTDNMSILGITIDYGPFGFMENYDPGYICNHSDYSGRYAFDQQPSIGLWNLYALAQALTPLIPNEKAALILNEYQPALVDEYAGLMRAKFGLEDNQEGDQQLVKDILDLLEQNQVDYTIFFRNLCENNSLRDMFVNREGFDTWRGRYLARLASEPRQNRVEMMKKANPKYVLRNYLAQIAIDKATSNKDYTEVNKLLDLLQKPYEEQAENEAYAKETPEWGRKLEISCSS